MYFQYANNDHVIWLNILWSDWSSEIYDDPAVYNWNQIRIKCDQNRWHHGKDNWCIVKGRYLIVFHHADDKIKYIDFMDVAKKREWEEFKDDWMECRYRLSKHFIPEAESKGYNSSNGYTVNWKSNVFVTATNDGIIHLIKDKGKSRGKKEQYRIELKDISPVLQYSIDEWSGFVYRYLCGDYVSINYVDVIQLICRYCYFFS